MQRYFSSDSVRYEVVDDRVILLDILDDEYHVFDEIASEAWLYILGDRALERSILNGMLEATDEETTGFLRDFTEKQLASGWLVNKPQEQTVVKAARGQQCAKSALQAWLILNQTFWMLKLRKFHTVYSRCRENASSNDAKTDPQVLETAVSRFARAERFFLLKSAPDDCLPRSIALFLYLRACNIPARHHIGVIRFPFRSHAWVEVDQRVLFDNQPTVDAYAKLAQT